MTKLVPVIIKVSEEAKNDFEVVLVAPDKGSEGEFMLFVDGDQAKDPESHRSDARATVAWQADKKTSYTSTTRIKTERGVFLVARQLKPDLSAFSAPWPIYTSTP